MSTVAYNLVSLVLVILILWGLNWMSSPKTAVKGNLLGAVCMFGAVVITLAGGGVVSLRALWISLLIGSAIGWYLGSTVKMIRMPQMVALLNGFGGGASALVAVTVLLNSGDIGAFSKITGTLALVVGGLTFSGSIIAAAKLDQRLPQRPMVIAGHTFLSCLMIAFMGLLVVFSGAVSGGWLDVVPVVTLMLALGFGVLFTVRVGGADMPVTISLLNSLSGVAGSIAGLAIYDPLLVAVGGIVGASGLLLTQIMCRAMNRNFVEVLTGKTSVPKTKSRENASSNQQEQEPETTSVSGTANQENMCLDPPGKETAITKGKKTEKEILQDAKKIVIVPGYGMALAQTQYQVKRLADLLEAQGKEVKYAIHPVAGRMPGHMNVLLAEVDVPYEKLYEMDTINPEFSETDVVIIVGANDVINPAASTAEGTPIYGMPILNVSEARHIFIFNKDKKPGYAGVDNPLYEREDVIKIFGDASETLEQMINQLG